MTHEERTDAFRRLGVTFVHCDICGGEMREPPDTFEGPNVVWSIQGRRATRRLLYVCGPECHRKAKEDT